MTKAEAKVAIAALIGEAKSDYEWGGSEDEDGRLWPGHPDFQKLRADIEAVIDQMTGN